MHRSEGRVHGFIDPATYSVALSVGVCAYAAAVHGTVLLKLKRLEHKLASQNQAIIDGLKAAVDDATTKIVDRINAGTPTPEVLDFSGLATSVQGLVTLANSAAPADGGTPSTDAPTAS
ncbi:hypothetical protein FGG44_gp05 [Mycobacterium phage MacnCheese]|uniref:Uncharacterized protein n=1 Tax=Mycobacterium phage MacnCheese TaxID=2927982 RepID=I6W809_9CAUD|nr:hypothetical protein FGG44_gp05 [Mycobacterium phage MacnCheese]AFN37795.1 hypothetical protein MACNCHEESE_5 [Mycobacterium phage MacnCheese]